MKRLLDAGASGAAVPPRPHAKLRAGSIWPPERGRQILRELALETAVRVTEVVGQQGRGDGSGSTDLIVERAGIWCLKTSPRRRFATEDEGRFAALGIVQRKLAIEGLLPPDSALALVGDDAGGAWIWTISPWMTTLRASLRRAEEANDDEALACGLESFARVAIQAIRIAAERAIRIDLHPSNFGWHGSELRYLDDDLGIGANLPAIGHSMLQRVEEYRAWPEAIAHYVRALEDGLAVEISAEAARLTALRASIEAVSSRCLEVAFARERLLLALLRSKRGG